MWLVLIIDSCCVILTVLYKADSRTSFFFLNICTLNFAVINAVLFETVFCSSDATFTVLLWSCSVCYFIAMMLH